MHGVPSPRCEVGRPAAVRAPQLPHAHALGLAREGVPLNIVQRQLGHANLGTTSIYLQGIDPEEIIATVHMRRAPMMSASAGLRL
jgi:site-specific recombinase XerD